MDLESLFLRALPLLKVAILTTLELGVCAFVLGSIVGLVIALMRLSRYPALRAAAFAYVSVFRGTPLLLQMLLIYFGLPYYGIVMDPFMAATLALTLFAAGYLSEDFRAGLLSVEKGQWEAGLSLGMGYAKTLRRVVLPQGLRISIPPVSSRLIGLMKDTSLASTVTVVELTRVANQVGAATFRYMDMFLIVGVLYWVISQTLTFAQTFLESRLTRRHG
ncbi:MULTISPECIES: amino acid ABC transporter permease [Burkholderia cepacia complex]|uniref:Glutamate/aspartate import permease protein GltK n=1 Tax=Burkholderia cepacia TaxID=292 RepID=A0AAE8NAU8_BURCE|nr:MULTISPECIES: amino acid ABC transporter permease [Burkholderia cepacia complex]KVE76829.1 ABC transporter permease [Burkholderia cepacia]KVL11743.1 ABC transporter permease [Burkholderia cepacia]KVQ32692.1 ABC transporter permease [Burkholderia cepacia]KVW16705.1 ABC transporter permease [Burkholderia cepacia]KVZ16583.1 ABC transporter permease [Burkholderia cepacia]